jgi:hypothetical protein
VLLYLALSYLRRRNHSDLRNGILDNDNGRLISGFGAGLLSCVSEFCVLFVDHIGAAIQDHCTDLSERDFTPEPCKLSIQPSEVMLTCVSARHTSLRGIHWQYRWIFFTSGWSPSLALYHGGRVTFVLSSTPIFRGGYLFSYNVSLASSLVRWPCPKAPGRYILRALYHPIYQVVSRRLIDADKDAEGMRVIADLDGGNLYDPIVVADFREIKDKVHEEVSTTCLLVNSLDVQWAKVDHIE